MDRPILMFVRLETWYGPPPFPIKFPTNCIHRRGIYRPTICWCLHHLGAAWDSPDSKFWVLPQGPVVIPLECLPGHFQSKHEFHPKLTCKTRRNMPRHRSAFQGTSFKHHGRSWTFDLQTTRNFTQCLYMYINSFKDLKTSWISYKHIKPHMTHIGILVVERLGRPLMFDI